MTITLSTTNIEVIPELNAVNLTITPTFTSGTDGGGVAQIQTDWEQEDNTKVDYIKNKPENIVQDAEYVHTDNNLTDALVQQIEAGAGEPAYSLTYTKETILWDDGWVKVPHTESVNYMRIIKNYSLEVTLGQGKTLLTPIICYPASETYGSTPYQGFLIRDIDNILLPDSDFEFVTIKYDIETETTYDSTTAWRYDCKSAILGNNVINDHSTGGEAHSAAMSYIFGQIYPAFTGEVIQSVLDPLANYDYILAKFTPTYCKHYEADLVMRPYAFGASTEQIGSNPNILTIASHGYNDFVREDITSGANVFNRNVIAVGSRVDDITTQSGTTYGYGLEFFEDQAKTAIDYPEFNPSDWNPFYQQSNACAIVAAKFRMIKDGTGVSWNVCRIAARATAKKTVGGQFLAGQVWDMYRGYGIIQVQDAIDWIKTNYTENESAINDIADKIEFENLKYKDQTYSSISENSPLPKKVVDEIYSKKLNCVSSAAPYDAQPNDLINADLSEGSFTITLPDLPPDKTVIYVKLNKTDPNAELTIQAGGSAKFNTSDGNTKIYMYLFGEFAQMQYCATTNLWTTFISAGTFNFATQFPGVDATTPITNANITVDTTTRVLTIVPPKGYFNIFVDGAGIITRYRKVGTISFPAFTDTSGNWFFYFNSLGQPIASQTPWTIDDFDTVCPIYRIVWNATLSGAAKLVDEYVEYHLNTIPATDHAWKHLQGAIWGSGFNLIHNTLSTGAPNADGRNAVIGITTGMNIDDNLEYRVTNDTSGLDWTQDMGNTTAALLTNANGGQFKVYTQTAGGLISYINANRFPFSASVNNIIEKISTTGVRSEVTNNYFLTVFIYATQNPNGGQSLRAIPYTTDYASITNARAVNWVDIQNLYPHFANDFEIRPLYKLIYEHRTSYDVGTKKAVLREYADIRKTIVSSSTTVGGSLPASSVTVVPIGNITETNVQSALQGIDTRLSTKELTLKIQSDITILTTGDGKYIYTVPSSLNGWTLTAIHASLTTVSSLNKPEFKVYNLTDSVEMLSTNVTIDANEFTSYDATTPAVISNGLVATKDRLRFDVVGAGIGAKGWSMILTFTKI